MIDFHRLDQQTQRVAILSLGMVATAAILAMPSCIQKASEYDEAAWRRRLESIRLLQQAPPTSNR